MQDVDKSSPMCDAIIKQVASAILGRSRLLVAFSGGLDSSVLLHTLVTLRASQLPELQLRAAYVHHGLSVHADQWGEHCAQICAAWQVPFQSLHVKVDTSHKGVEAGARDARYQALARIIDTTETLLTAQHSDDQCETFFLALKRGSGPAGLSSMAMEKAFFQREQLRPLLPISRQQLADYATQHQLTWVEDDSNQDDRFDRNFLRCHIMPSLRQRWPYFPEAVARSAQLCAEQERLLDELLHDSVQRAIDEQGTLAIEVLQNISQVKRHALLRRWLARFSVPYPTQEQLRCIWQEVALARKDANPVLKLGEHQIRRFRQRLYLLPLISSLKAWQSVWDTQQPLKLPEDLGTLTRTSAGIAVRAPHPEETVSVRFVAQGTQRIVGREHARAIKKIWQELGIPPWQRERIPMLYYNDELIAALGVFVTHAGYVRDTASAWYIHWEKDARQDTER